jgi:hypothetical protein
LSRRISRLRIGRLAVGAGTSLSGEFRAPSLSRLGSACGERSVTLPLPPGDLEGEVHFIDGDAPGHDWLGVRLSSEDAIEKLNACFAERDIEIVLERA